LNTNDIAHFADSFVPEGLNRADPEISPIHADLAGLGPALFSAGSRDPLLDDTLFMAPRWLAAGNDTELDIYPGGAHVFINFPGKLQAEAARRIHGFLNRCTA